MNNKFFIRWFTSTHFLASLIISHMINKRMDTVYNLQTFSVALVITLIVMIMFVIHENTKPFSI